MPKRNAKGHFVKSGHSHKSKSRAMTVARPSVTVIRTTSSAPHKKHKKRHGGGKRGGGGMNLTHLAIAGAGLAYLTGASSPVKSISDNIAKLPGAKTFGNPATAGLACLAVDRFVKRNKWLRAAGIVGVVLGAVQFGTQGKDFKWVGDAGAGSGAAEDSFSGDVEGDDGDMLGDEE